MRDEHLAIRRFLHIQLDQVGVLLGREAKRRQGILGRDSR